MAVLAPAHQAPAHIWPVQLDHDRAELLCHLLDTATTTLKVQAARGTPGAELGRTAERLDTVAVEPGWADQGERAVTLRSLRDDLTSAIARLEPAPAERDTPLPGDPTGREAGHER